MTTSRPWHEAFLAVSAVLGEPIDASLDAIDAHGSADAQELVASLRSGSRHARARGLARALTRIVVALAEARLA